MEWNSSRAQASKCWPCTRTCWIKVYREGIRAQLEFSSVALAQHKMPNPCNGQVNDVSTFYLQLCTKASLGIFPVQSNDQARLSHTNELWSSWRTKRRTRNAKYMGKDKPDWRPPGLCYHLKLTEKSTVPVPSRDNARFSSALSPLKLKGSI